MNAARRVSAVFGCLTALILFCPAHAASSGENDFYRNLMKKKVATNADVLRSLARFKGYRGADQTDAELEYLRGAGVGVPRAVAAYPQRPATKGAAAGMFLNAMKSAADQRGLFGRIFTGSRRYAARDGKAQKLLPDDSIANEFMDGGDLMAILGRAVEQTRETSK